MPTLLQNVTSCKKHANMLTAWVSMIFYLETMMLQGLSMYQKAENQQNKGLEALQKNLTIRIL